MGCEDGQRLAVLAEQVELDPVDAPQHEALRGKRVLVPYPTGRELGKAPVVLRHVLADAQIPLRPLDQAHGMVATPAGPVLDLDRREHRLAGVTPVHAAGPAIDQSGLQQGQEQPLRPAVHDRLGAHESALPVEGKAEPAQLQNHVLGAAIHPVAGRLFAGDRAKLGGQPEGVEAEGEQHVLAAPPAKARVSIPDRIAAHVPDMDVPRGERSRGLDVLARAILADRGRAKGVLLMPSGLATSLDYLGVIAGEIVVAHLTENTQAQPRRGRQARCYARPPRL